MEHRKIDQIEKAVKIIPKLAGIVQDQSLGLQKNCYMARGEWTMGEE